MNIGNIFQKILNKISPPPIIGIKDTIEPIKFNPKLSIKKRLLTVNRWSRPGRKRLGVKGIEVHWVANANTSAKFNRRYFESRKHGNLKFGSTHYVIDLNGKVLHIIPEDEIAYSSGAKHYNNWVKRELGTPPYNNTISIECTHIDDDGTMTEKTQDSLLLLCVTLCKKYNLDSQNLYLHYDISGKDCHRYFVNNPNKWEKFKLSVDYILNPTGEDHE